MSLSLSAILEAVVSRALSQVDPSTVTNLQSQVTDITAKYQADEVTLSDVSNELKTAKEQLSVQSARLSELEPVASALLEIAAKLGIEDSAHVVAPIV